MERQKWDHLQEYPIITFKIEKLWPHEMNFAGNISCSHDSSSPPPLSRPSLQPATPTSEQCMHMHSENERYTLQLWTFLSWPSIIASTARFYVQTHRMRLVFTFFYVLHLLAGNLSLLIWHKGALELCISAKPCTLWQPPFWPPANLTHPLPMYCADARTDILPLSESRAWILA